MTRRGGPLSPFDVLGLPASGELTDDDVRAAWRRIAAATHPDRADGGDRERFAQASAAYTALRTRFARGEVLADLAGLGGFGGLRDFGGLRGFGSLGGPGAATAQPVAAAPSPARAAPPEATSQAPDAIAGPPGTAAHAPGGTRARGGWPGRVYWRIRRGRPGVLAVRAGIAAAVGTISVVAIGFAPSALALITGAATWLALTARNDLAPPGPG